MRLISFGLAVLVVVAVSIAHGAENPLQRTESLLTNFKAVNSSDGAPLDTEGKKANAAVFAHLDDLFAFGQFTLETIKPHIGKFSATQQKDFKNVFAELIRLVAYPRAGDFLRRAETKLKADKSNSDRVGVTMEAFLREDDLETSTVFFWQKVDGPWRVVDVSFDGASLVKDYQNQFGRIIKKHGVVGLLEKLKKRLDKQRG